MTIQDSAYRGGRQPPPPRGAARAFPVPSEHEAFRRYRADFCRKAALRSGRTERPVAHAGPPPATPVEPAERRIAKVLRRVDRAAMGLMSGAVLALLPFAVSLLIGLV